MLFWQVTDESWLARKEELSPHVGEVLGYAPGGPYKKLWGPSVLLIGWVGAGSCAEPPRSLLPTPLYFSFSLSVFPSSPPMGNEILVSSSTTASL